MNAKLWILVFTAFLFSAFTGCGKSAAQEAKLTQKASLEAADKAFCEEGAAQAEAFFESGAASCPVLHSYGPYPSYYLDDGAPLVSFWADVKTESYPWRPIETNDMERYDYPAVEPYLTDIRENADGTKTLLVCCLSTDVPTDCLFSHALTVRDLPGGGFQFVSNRITFQTALALPNAAPRLRAK